MDEKKQLRRDLLSRRDALSMEELRRAEILITERILGHQWFYRSDTILGFMSFGSEIETRQLLEEALRKNKKVFLPRVEGENMRFYRTGLDENGCFTGLKEGYKGIMEPDGRSEVYVYDEAEAERSLLLMPGVGFDPYRNRLGYGKGFYDRFLADKPQLLIRSIAIGHACQLVPEIPAGEFDLKPYQVILV